LKVRVKEKDSIKNFMNNIVNNRFNKVEAEITYNERERKLRDLLRN